MKPRWAQQAGSLGPAVFRRYLATAGWESSERSKTWRYTCDHATGPVTVDVPKRQEFIDYERRVVELVEILATVEERTPSSVLFDLGYPAADKLAFRFESTEIQSGTISIDDAWRIRGAQRQLLLSAAHSVLEPLAHHPRLSKTEAVEFLASCRAAPPRAGSYVAPVLVPVAPAMGQTGLDDPFPRRVTKLLATALRATSDALDSGQDELLLTGARSGLSSNLLGAFSELRPPGQGYLEVSFTWAPGRKAPDTPRVVRFEHTLFDAMAEAARVLRETTPSPGTTLEGYFTKLERSPRDTTAPGEVALVAQVEERPNSTQVYMTLSAQAYQAALDAHGDAARVRVTGTLARNGRRFVLRNPGDVVRVLDDDDT